MKKSVTAAVFLSLSCLLSAANLIKDGDFETPGGWWFDGPKDPPSFEFVKADAWSGKSCMKIYKYAWNRCVKLEEGKTYKLTIAVKCVNCPKEAFSLRMDDRKFGGGWLSRNWKIDLLTSGGNHDWEELTLIITPDMVRKGADGFLYLYHLNQGGEVYVDALELEELPEED